MKRILNFKYNYILGMISFLLSSLSYLISYEETNRHHLLIPVKMTLIFVSAILYCLSCNDNCPNKTKRSFAILSFIILVYEVLLFCAVGKTVFYIHDYPAILIFVVWIPSSIISLTRFGKELWQQIRSIFTGRKLSPLVLLSTLAAMIVILLSLEPNGIRFTWDSDTLYEFVYSLEYDSLFDARQLMFMRVHVSLIYVHIIVLFKLLFGNIRIAFWLFNAICIILASFGMTFLLKALAPGKKNSMYILGNAIFMLSPWVCGISTYNIYDYCIYCLFPLLMLFYLRHNWIGFFCIGTVISFSRAPGIVVFGGVCLGILIIDILRISGAADSKEHISPIRHIASNPKYWFFLSIAIVFLLFFYFGRDVNRQFGDTVLGIDFNHIIQEVKIFTSCNFLWIFFILTLLYLIFTYAVKKESVLSESGTALFIMAVSDLILVLFYCLFITYRIPRYMDSHIAFLYICGILMLLSIKKEKLSALLMAMICAITFIGSFRMIDPVSLSLFNTINVGDHNIVDFEISPTPSIEDSIICNREYYSYEVLLGDAVKYVIESKDDKDEVLFSLGDQSLTWGFSGGRYSYSIDSDKHYFEMFFDNTINGIANGYAYEYYSRPDMIPFDMHYVFPEETLESALKSSDSTKFYYLYMPTLNAGKESEISQNYSIKSIKEFEYRGWKMNCIEFTV